MRFLPSDDHDSNRINPERVRYQFVSPTEELFFTLWAFFDDESRNDDFRLRLWVQNKREFNSLRRGKGGGVDIDLDGYFSAELLPEGSAAVPLEELVRSIGDVVGTTKMALADFLAPLVKELYVGEEDRDEDLDSAEISFGLTIAIPDPKRHGFASSVVANGKFSAKLLSQYLKIEPIK